jgi:signal-transduction protein with cAMP-binding, CBS, and nucleotidyltransferase domain
MTTDITFTGVDLRGPARVLTARSTLGDLPLRTAVRVGRRCTLAEAVERMEQHGVSSVLVDGDGIVTERDIARAMAHGAPATEVVEAIATWHPITVPATMPIVEAAAVMLNEHVRHLLVERGGHTAVVSLRDVTALLLQAANPEPWLTSLRIAVPSPAEIWLG